jgi:predicted nucleic-acid-binding Zn-ribbon protein
MKIKTRRLHEDHHLHRMSKFDTKKFITFITEKWGGKSCPMCGKGPWSVQEKVFQLTEFHDGNMVIGGPLMPLVPVTCNNCGYTVVVNAIIAGAVTTPAQLPEQKG